MSTGTLIERVEDPASPPVEERFAPASRPARPAVETIRETHAMRIMWRGLELPTRVVRDEASATPKYARFTIEPFERGFGTTVGNSIRRILLSSLEGAAVSSVKIAGQRNRIVLAQPLTDAFPAGTDISVLNRVRYYVLPNQAGTVRLMRMVDGGANALIGNLKAARFSYFARSGAPAIDPASVALVRIEAESDATHLSVTKDIAIRSQL